jgi:4-amino-4-deoxy-L-arabinose transferase-like glycosyltransferase
MWTDPRAKLVLLALLIKAVLVSLTLVLFGASPDPVTAIGRSWDHWDAEHYLYLASHGYRATGEARNLIAFFPLYPALIAAIATTGLPARVAALLISNVAGVLAAILLYEVARKDGTEAQAWRAAAFFTLFPTAYFLLVGYTEALFCALAFGAVLMARRERWLASGLLAGLAAAARLTGFCLLPFLVLELWRIRQALWHKLIPPFMVLLGLLVYLATNQLVLGNPFAFVTVQEQQWSHSLAAPWVGFADAIRSVSRRLAWEQLTVGAGEIAGGLAAYATTTLAWLRLRPADAVYASVLTAMVTFLPFWLSIPRYLLSLYPLFLLVGRIERSLLYRPLLIVSSIGLVVFAMAFGRGYWAF